jgi:integrase
MSVGPSRNELNYTPSQTCGNIVRIITETGLRVYKELLSMKKDQLDLPNAVVWIPDFKTPNGIAEVKLTPLAVDAFRDQLAIAGDGPFLFPSDLNPTGHQVELKTVLQRSLRRAKVPYLRIYDLRSTYATRLSAGGVDFGFLRAAFCRDIRLLGTDCTFRSPASVLPLGWVM